MPLVAISSSYSESLVNLALLVIPALYRIDCTETGTVDLKASFLEYLTPVSGSMLFCNDVSVSLTNHE